MTADKDTRTAEDSHESRSAAHKDTRSKTSSSQVKSKSITVCLLQDSEARTAGVKELSDQKLTKYIEKTSFQDRSKALSVTDITGKTNGNCSCHYGDALVEEFQELSVKNNKTGDKGKRELMKDDKSTTRQRDAPSENGGKILERGPVMTPRTALHTAMRPYSRQGEKTFEMQSHVHHLSGGRLVTNIGAENEDNSYHPNLFQMEGELQNYQGRHNIMGMDTHKNISLTNIESPEISDILDTFLMCEDNIKEEDNRYYNNKQFSQFHDSHTTEYYNQLCPDSDNINSQHSTSSPFGREQVLSPQVTHGWQVSGLNQASAASHCAHIDSQSSCMNSQAVFSSKFSSPVDVDPLSCQSVSPAQVVPDENNYPYGYINISSELSSSYCDSSPSNFSADSPMSVASNSSYQQLNSWPEQWENVSPLPEMFSDDSNSEIQDSEAKKERRIREIVDYLKENSSESNDETNHYDSHFSPVSSEAYKPTSTAVTTGIVYPVTDTPTASVRHCRDTAVTSHPPYQTARTEAIAAVPASVIQGDRSVVFTKNITSNQVTQSAVGVSEQGQNRISYSLVNPQTKQLSSVNSLPNNRNNFSCDGTQFSIFTSNAKSIINGQKLTNGTTNCQILYIPVSLSTTVATKSLLTTAPVTERNNVPIQPKIIINNHSCQSYTPLPSAPHQTTTQLLLEKTEPVERIRALNKFTKCSMDQLITPDENGNNYLHSLLEFMDGISTKQGNSADLAKLWALVKTLKDANKHEALTAKNLYGYTPLYLSCIWNKPLVAGFLAETMADINADVNDNMSYTGNANGGNGMLHLICNLGDTYVAVLEKILCVKKKNGEPIFDVNKTNDQGETPLHVAVKCHGKVNAKFGSVSCIKTVKLLLQYSASPQITEGMNGRTPIYLAIQETNDPELISELLDNCSQVDKLLNEYRTYSGDTALHRAASHNNLSIAGQKKIIELLLEKGAQVDIKDRQGRLPINLVSREREEVKKLLKKRR